MSRHAVNPENMLALCGSGRPYRFPPGDTYVFTSDDLEKHPITCPGCVEELPEKEAAQKKRVSGRDSALSTLPPKCTYTIPATRTLPHKRWRLRMGLLGRFFDWATLGWWSKFCGDPEP